jgi:hypothetical protein
MKVETSRTVALGGRVGMRHAVANVDAKRVSKRTSYGDTSFITGRGCDGDRYIAGFISSIVRHDTALEDGD